jgi:hypothetical protein
VLADDYYRLAHDDVTGKPRLHSTAMDMGCAAALLAELIRDRRIVVEEGAVVVTDRKPPDDSLMHTVLDQLVAEEGRRHDVRTWLTFLSKEAAQQIAQRLLRGGHVRMTAVRKLGRQTGVVYVPVDMNEAARPWALLSQRLRRHEPLGYDELSLAGLARATGLESLLLDGAPATTFEFLNHQVGTLWPPMRWLLFHTHASIGGAVLAHRT